MSKFELTVSIVLFKTDKLEIENIIKQLLETKLRWKLFLIDNSPENTLQEFFENFNDNVEYIFMNANLGFGKAHNLVINKIKTLSEFHLIMNSDIDFEASILDQMLTYMRADYEIGLLAPKVLNMDGTIQYTAKLLPQPLDLIVRRFVPIESIQDYFNNKYELRFISFDKTMETPCFTGCFLLVNCRVFTEIEGFDEQFFMYSEDIDFTRRINQKFKTIYYPNVSIFHQHGKGSYKNIKLLYYHIRSMVKYYNKWGWFFDKERINVNKKTLSQFDEVI
ncbi:MAG: glycosyltransferase family 2 protein [Ferruginibacter sp.]